MAKRGRPRKRREEDEVPANIEDAFEENADDEDVEDNFDDRDDL